jgi:hypothetical protein
MGINTNSRTRLAANWRKFVKAKLKRALKTLVNEYQPPKKVVLLTLTGSAGP